MVEGPLLRIRGRDRVVDGALVMGIVNASPESFSDAGRYSSLDRQLALAEELVTAGADIVDIGGQSASNLRPEITVGDEIGRVVPIVERLHRDHPDVLISVDTYRSPVADAAVASGAAIVNDVSGLADPDLAGVCARSGAALVIMHTRARPKTYRQDRDLYTDVTADVVAFLHERMQVARDRGVADASIVLDPGPDFAKTPHQTVAMLRRMEDVRALGRPVLLALSRKDFLGAILGARPRGRDVATIAAIAHFAAQPGYLFRVHDVRAVREALAVVDVLSGRREIDPDYLLPGDLSFEPPA